MGFVIFQEEEIRDIFLSFHFFLCGILVLLSFFSFLSSFFFFLICLMFFYVLIYLVFWLWRLDDLKAQRKGTFSLSGNLEYGKFIITAEGVRK